MTKLMVLNDLLLNIESTVLCMRMSLPSMTVSLRAHANSIRCGRALKRASPHGCCWLWAITVPYLTVRIMRLHREQILSCQHNEIWAVFRVARSRTRTGTGTHTSICRILICPTSHLCLTFKGNCIHAQPVWCTMWTTETLPPFLPFLPTPSCSATTPPPLLTGSLIYDSNSPVQTRRRGPRSQLYSM